MSSRERRIERNIQKHKDTEAAKRRLESLDRGETLTQEQMMKEFGVAHEMLDDIEVEHLPHELDPDMIRPEEDEDQ